MNEHNNPRVLVLNEMRKHTALLERILAALGNGPAANAPAASDSDLDGAHGDPVVKAKDPRDWSGEPMRGRKFSECPPAYLDMVADRAEHFARKNAEAGDEKKAGYDRRDARRARGWAARLRSGWTAPVVDPDDGHGNHVTDEDVKW